MITVGQKDKTILIVEDEALIRVELVDYFEDEGYRVFEAESADQAIAVLEHHKSVRVVLTDVHMPGTMDGLRLAHYVRDRYPPTILVLTSGAALLSPTDLPADSFFVPKPFDVGMIMRKIEQMF
ncbi:response regulator [uncultured Agrobacterium sp.]|uniref:response regulator n=1 Tax=uncultured Agrobacterium sp. TaxID=157277 RepID=UPI0025D87184|nr:response regulator [uncultured Agrobacterium sp.]